MNRIRETVLSVTEQVERMSSAAEEVTASSDEMVKSIESVNAITEETTASTEQMAASNYGQWIRSTKSLRNLEKRSMKNWPPRY